MCHQKVVYDHPYIGRHDLSFFGADHFAQLAIGHFPVLQYQLHIFSLGTFNSTLFYIASVLYGRYGGGVS